ncbi:MAG: amidohydrolase, partial [bacterium]|nr:amidohydrolase [bacterium]
EFHQHPEIRFQEKWTSERIARFLDEVGVPYKGGLAKGTGIVATLEGGKRLPDTRTVALRSDIDALDIQEETGLPYASRIPNRMHGCGHDGHMACLCGAVRTLKEHQQELAGTVKFLFQPAEEIEGGARFMVEDGALEGVDVIFGLHGFPDLPVGHIIVKPGPFMASANFFRVDVQGKGCHGADPGAGIDPVVVAAHITTALQTVISRELDPWESGVVTVAHIEAGTTSNIIADTAFLEGTIRTLTPEADEHVRASVRRIVEHTAQAFRATATVDFGEVAYPALHNDPESAAFVRDTAIDLFGAERVVDPGHPYMVAEDFAYYLDQVPGAFFFLGVNPDPSIPYPPLHTTKYDFCDEALRPGIRLLSHLAARALQQD